MLAKCLKNNRNVAVKLIHNFTKSEYQCANVAREICIMNHIQANSNEYSFTPHIYDIIMPDSK
jgi:hypothetical protein